MEQKTEEQAGFTLIRNHRLNKGLRFSSEERQALGVEGYFPEAIFTLEQQVDRVVSRVRALSTPLEKYVYLQSIQDADEDLYFATLISNVQEFMPIVYTPVVGAACQEFSHIYRQTPRGLYLHLGMRGRVREVLGNWHLKDKVKAIVFTDGERILGLGDQGVNGMGIPIGKLALYTACAGVHPEFCLPVHLDVGTNNQGNLEDPLYMGIRAPRVQGEEYDAFVGEFMEAAMEIFGETTMLQFEDFGNTNAFRLLTQWADRACTFNDDIQGTASVILGGLISSVKLTGTELKDHTFLFSGAGEAGVGIAELIAQFIVLYNEGMSIEQARSKIFLVDSRGLVVKEREASLQHHKLPFAHDVPSASTLMDAINQLQPTALIGVSAQPGIFTQEVCERMAELSEAPLIFALSNPTSKAECTAEQAYEWTQGRCIFASGSPFDPVTVNGMQKIPGQGNNAYIFPGVGLGVVAVGVSRINDEDMVVAAETLARQVTQDRLDVGCLYPPLSEIREVSVHIAAAIAELAYKRGTATLQPKPDDLLAYCRSQQYNPLS